MYLNCITPILAEDETEEDTMALFTAELIANSPIEDGIHLLVARDEKGVYIGFGDINDDTIIGKSTDVDFYVNSVLVTYLGNGSIINNGAENEPISLGCLGLALLSVGASLDSLHNKDIKNHTLH